MENVNRKTKFPVVAIFFFIIAAWMLAGYIYRFEEIIDVLDRILEDFDDWNGLFFLRYIFPYVSDILSLIPTLAYVFLGIAMLLPKKEKFVPIAIFALAVSEMIIGGLNFFEARYFRLPTFRLTIALLFIALISKCKLSNATKKVFSILAINACILRDLINCISTYGYIINEYDEGWEYFFTDLAWITLVALTATFFMFWVLNPYKNKEEAPQRVAPAWMPPHTAPAYTNAAPCYPQPESIPYQPQPAPYQPPMAAPYPPQMPATPYQPQTTSAPYTPQAPLYAQTETENADWTKRLLDLKMLLDSGVITQAEFDAKKRQFLGL